jgi:hypothetical protein
LEWYNHWGQVNGMPGELKEAIRQFIEYYNYRRYHEGLGDVTPFDVYAGRDLEVFARRKGAKHETLEARRGYNTAESALIATGNGNCPITGD